MTLPLLGAGPPSAASAAPATFSPADIPGLLSAVVVSVSRAAGLLFQDAAKTTPATAQNDPVRVATCPYTATDWVAPSDAARPLLQTDGTHWWALHDGSNDGLLGPVAATLSGASSLCLRASESSASSSRVVQSGTFNCVMSIRRNALNCLYCQGTIRNAPLTSDANPHTLVLQKAAGGFWAPYYDGTLAAVDDNVATEWGRAASGAGGSQAESFPGKLYGLLVYARSLSDSERSSVGSFLGGLS